MDLAARKQPTVVRDFATPEDSLADFFYKLECTDLGENLAWLDLQIRTFDLNFIFIGACLHRIRLYHLYKSDYGDFKEYCTRALRKSYGYCLRLIQASQTAEILIKENFDRLPTCESQIRPIAQLMPKDKYGNLDFSKINPEAPSPEYLWQEVLRNADEKNNGLITADLVQKVVDAELDLTTQKQQERKRKVTVSNQSKQRLSRIALEEGRSESEILEEMINRRYLELELEPIEDDSEEFEPDEIDDRDDDDDTGDDIAKWQSDLESLISLYDSGSSSLVPPSQPVPSRSPPG